MTAPDPRLTAAACLRAHAEWLGDALADDAIVGVEIRADTWRRILTLFALADALEADAAADATACPFTFPEQVHHDAP